MTSPSSRAVRVARASAGLVLGLGWLLPLAAGKIAARAAPDSAMAFRWIAGIWLVLALVYGVVIAIRVRRGLVR